MIEELTWCALGVVAALLFCCAWGVVSTGEDVLAADRAGQPP